MPEVLIHFLRYVGKSTGVCAGQSRDEVIQKLHTKIEVLKQSRDLEARYMQLEDMLRAREREGKCEGKQQILILIKQMSADGKADLIPRLSEDEEFCEKMLKEYGL